MGELYGKDTITREQFETASEMRQQWATSTREGTMENIENIDHLELVWMGWVLSDITQFSVSIIQIMWVPWMSICLDEFWIIVSITQFSDFWGMSYENWKHILGAFSFQNSIFNGIFVIKPTYPATMFDKRIFFFFFFWVKPSCNVWQILYFFFFLVKPSHNFWSWKLRLS